MITESEKVEYRELMDTTINAFDKLSIPQTIRIQAFGIITGVIHGFLTTHPKVCGSDLHDAFNSMRRPKDNPN